MNEITFFPPFFSDDSIAPDVEIDYSSVQTWDSSLEGDDDDSGDGDGYGSGGYGSGDGGGGDSSGGGDSDYYYDDNYSLGE